jgi:DNA primase
VSEVYTTAGAVASASRPPGTGSVIEAAKEQVPTIDLADRLCGPGQLRRIGERWTARCPLPDHDEKTPSFTVYPGDGGWWCYGCNKGGDVVNLAALAWGIDRADVAAAEVLMTFGYEIPSRSDAWFDRQCRQAPIRDRIHRTRVEHIRLIVFRLIWMPWLKRLPEDVRAEATEGAWRDSLWMAERVYDSRRGS